MHFPVLSIVIGLLVAVHASPLRSADHHIGSVKAASKLVPRAFAEFPGSADPAERAYVQCIALWVVQQLRDIREGRGPKTVVEEIQAHNRGEEECFQLITAQYPTGLRVRFTKAGTDWIISGYLRRDGQPGRPDAEPKLVDARLTGGRDDDGRRDPNSHVNDRPNGASDGNGLHPISVKDLPSKAVQGWNALSAAFRDSVPHLKTLVSSHLGQPLVMRPLRLPTVGLPKLALVPRSERPKHGG